MRGVLNSFFINRRLRPVITPQSCRFFVPALAVHALILIKWRGLIHVILLLCLPQMALAQVAASVAHPASVYLEQANIPRAKALALDAALSKGWQVAVSATDHSVFETMIPASQASEPAGAEFNDAESSPVLLRIRADYMRELGGVRVLLTATEFHAPGTQAETRVDVTETYSTNLNNALASLRSQWEDVALGGRGNARRRPTSNQSQAAPASQHGRASVRQPPPPEIGQWAYEAEQSAVRRGCHLGERGAVLLGGRVQNKNSGHELHRVHCKNRSALLVRCDTEGCRVGS